MIDYLSFISTDPPDKPQTPQALSTAGHGFQRLQLHHGFYSKKASLPLLYRESIPELPHMLDLGKHLAIITSVVVRHTRRHLPSRLGSPSEQDFDLFCQRCLEVEEKALMQVSKMAGSSRADPSKDINSPISNKSPTSTRERRTPSSERHRLSYRRPTTAPGDANFLRNQPSTSDMSSSPGASNTNIPRIAPIESPIPIHPIDSSATRSLEAMRGTEDSHMIYNRPPLIHHPRSASTDSALSRKARYNVPPSPTNTAACLPFAPDSTDEMGGRRKRLFRARLWK